MTQNYDNDQYDDGADCWNCRARWIEFYLHDDRGQHDRNQARYRQYGQRSDPDRMAPDNLKVPIKNMKPLAKQKLVNVSTSSSPAASFDTAPRIR